MMGRVFLFNGSNDYLTSEDGAAILSSIVVNTRTNIYFWEIFF
jgi:hypothetical protein